VLIDGTLIGYFETHHMFSPYNPCNSSEVEGVFFTKIELAVLARINDFAGSTI
jgi:hypothetical protein